MSQYFAEHGAELFSVGIEVIPIVPRKKFPAIEGWQSMEITEEVVEFNDRYEVLTPEKLAGGLSEDLSRVGETLAVRFELEDRLFAALLARS